MPPRSRKRIGRSSTPVHQSESESDYTSNSEGTPGSKPHCIPITPATKGFLSLPPELIYQVLSHFKEIRAEHILGCTNYINDSIPEDFLTRFNVLRALSQLSRLSRSIFLPLLWERFQACLAPDSGWTWESDNFIGNMLERRSRGLLESEYLWSYVKKVTVPICWPRWTRNLDALSLFAQVLAVLPNVRTLEVLRTGSLAPRDLEKCFRGKVFPSIQKVILPTRAHELLRCCPKVREVTCNEGDGGQLASALTHGGCSNLEVLRGVTPRQALMKRLAKAKPPLKCVRIDGENGKTPTEETISTLSAFHSLRVIEIECPCIDDKDLDRVVKFASEALRKSTKGISVRRDRNLRRATKNALLADPESIYPESKLVRILRHRSKSIRIYNQTHLAPVSASMEVFVVEG